ncbi:hypothetical protein JTB14_023990 [Gonioctena quinquepunctata]|nr:hypothetical protein JTB14_023990 [Gonioctena quinquepunctata]
MTQHYCQQWSKNYLNTLQQRYKWRFNIPSPDLIGSLVLLKEENNPPQFWPTGRIIDVHPGQDKIARVVSIRTRNGTVKRALNKIALLPIDEHS